MERDLKNKVIAITGGVQRIGYHIADSFLQKGARVAILLDINEEAGAEAVKTLTAKHGSDKAEFLKCDVTTDLDEVLAKLISKYGTVDVLVNCAGVVDETSVKRIIGVNTIALMEWTMKFWEHMRTDKGGKGGTIINLATLYCYDTDPFFPLFKGSKFAVLGFSKTLGHAMNYEKDKVRILILCPGYTDTNVLVRNSHVIDNMGLREEFYEFFANIPLLKLDKIHNTIIEIFENAESGTVWNISEKCEHLQQIH